MDEFLHRSPSWPTRPRRSDQIPILTDAPSIAAGDQPLDAEAAAAPKIEATAGAEKIEPALEAPTLPPAGRLPESTAIVPFRRPEAKQEPKAEPAAAPQARNTRFALLAASVAIAASLGAIGGSLGVAKFGPMLAPPPAPVIAAHPPKENVADEMKALKDTVTQLRTATARSARISLRSRPA